MAQEWYSRWEDMYLGSDAEYRSFEKWYADHRKSPGFDPDDSETDLLCSFRDTQSWTDSFLDWAWVMESDESREAQMEAGR